VTADHSRNRCRSSPAPRKSRRAGLYQRRNSMSAGLRRHSRSRSNPNSPSWGSHWYRLNPMASDRALNQIMDVIARMAVAPVGFRVHLQGRSMMAESLKDGSGVIVPPAPTARRKKFPRQDLRMDLRVVIPWNTSPRQRDKTVWLPSQSK